MKMNFFNSLYDFQSAALSVFRYQAKYNPVYREYLDLLKCNVLHINDISSIPFLPIGLFKTRQVRVLEKKTSLVFQSSGTGNGTRSTHYVADENLYRNSILKGFSPVFGDPSRYHILALLPSYMERGDSSLIYMVNYLMELSGSPYQGYFLHDFDELKNRILTLDRLADRKILLFGVSYALLDFAEHVQSLKTEHLMVMETGGMKGKRREIVRSELHKKLCRSLGVDRIYSEYGMTELLSQAYSTGNGIFYPPPWMKVLIRSQEDPFALLPAGKTGGINIVDLSNYYSCSFIATDDLGRITPDGGFEVLGRFDSADIRGCNLMVE